MAFSATANTTTAAGERAGLHGAVATLRDLVGLRIAAGRLNWTRPQRARAAVSGLKSSRFRGRGIDFAEVRAYEPGDDVRAIDWRVTARTGRVHTKVFQEERERPVLAVADLGPRTFFGTRRRLKSLAITELSALLLWSAFENGDRVGAIVRGIDGHQAFRPRHSRDSVLRVLRRLQQGCEHLAEHHQGSFDPRSAVDPAAAPFTLADALAQARRVARPGTHVVVISDFLDLQTDDAVREAALRNLQLLGRHCDLDTILVSDPFERELPPADLYPVTDGERRIMLDTAPDAARSRWHEAFEARATTVQDTTWSARGRMLRAGTEDDLDRLLAEWLR